MNYLLVIGGWFAVAILLGPFVGRFLRGPSKKEGDKK